MVVYHLHGETGSSTVCANGKQKIHDRKFRSDEHLTRVNPSANAVIKGCPQQLKIEMK